MATLTSISDATGPPCDSQPTARARRYRREVLVDGRREIRQTHAGEVLVRRAREAFTAIALAEVGIKARRGVAAGTLDVVAITSAEHLLPGPIITLLANAPFRLPASPTNACCCASAVRGTRDHLEQSINKHGVRPEPADELGSNETLKQAAMAGLGIACLSHHTYPMEAQTGRFVRLDVQDTPVIREWNVVARSDRPLTLAAEALMDFLHTEGAASLQAHTA